MILDKFELAEYLKFHPEHLIYASDEIGRKVQLTLDVGHDLKCDCANQIYVYNTDVELYMGPDKVLAKIALADLDIVKRYFLAKRFRIELAGLIRPAQELASHYKSPLEHRPARIQLHVLRDIDYAQDNKGMVIIVPEADVGSGYVPREVSDGHVIKGYVYHSDSGTVRYETVQAWRYAKVTPTMADLDVYDTLSADWKLVLGL
jgi:hypothetical protein